MESILRQNILEIESSSIVVLKSLLIRNVITDLRCFRYLTIHVHCFIKFSTLLDLLAKSVSPVCRVVSPVFIPQKFKNQRGDNIQKDCLYRAYPLNKNQQPRAYGPRLNNKRTAHPSRRTFQLSSGQALSKGNLGQNCRVRKKQSVTNQLASLV